LQRWNDAEEELDLSNGGVLRTIGEAHRLAWETFLITVAAHQDRRNRRTPFTAEQFGLMMGGDLVGEGRHSTPRDTQFELYVAATLRLAGATVRRGEPDLRLLYGPEETGIAVKRIRSLNPDQVQKNARDAAKQIAGEGLRGWIALNLDSRFARISGGQPEDTLLRDMEAVFDSVGRALRRPAGKPHVLGFMLFGYVIDWQPPTPGEDAPRLHFSPPMRWYALTEDAGEVLLFDDFTREWSERMSKRLDVLTSRHFTGQL
jgi:hypothetical protein